jgi:hypothetical protein
MVVQSSGSPTGTISGIHFGSPKNLCHLDVASTASCRDTIWGKVVASPESRPWWVLCHNPTLAKCGGWSPTLGKVGDLESSATPECSELDSKTQKTSHWGFIDVIGKILKRRYRKWPCIGHLDIFSPSYGQKKGRESNCQFDSRPLKVRNRCLPDIGFECATWRWKDLDEGYNFGSDLVAIQLCSPELWPFKVPKVPQGQFRDSREFVPFGCSLHGELQRILKGVRWWLTPESGPWWVLCVQVPVACLNTQGCSEC